MTSSFYRCALLLAVGLSLVACDAEFSVGNPDASPFADAGGDAATEPDANAGDDAGTDDAGSDAATDAGTGNDASTGPDIADVAERLAAAQCAALQACDMAALLTINLGGETCSEITASVYAARDLSVLADSITAGRIQLDRSRLTACQNAIAAQGCDVQTMRRPTACNEALRGQVSLGGDCVINEDCAGTSTFCQAQNQCPGRCANLLNAAAPCTNSDQCANGLLCAVLDGTRQCLTPGGPGAYCGYTDTPPCKRGHTCTPNVGDDDTCKAYSVVYVRQVGQTCDPDNGSYCERGLSCTNTPTGVICSAPAPRDGTCYRSHRLQPFHCPVDQYCNAIPGEAGTCQDLPDDGEDCLPDTRLNRCAPGNVCLADNVCHLKVENGEPCDNNTQCFSNNCAGTVCAPPAALCVP